MTASKTPIMPTERDHQLLEVFHTLDDLGQNLALVLLKALAGNPHLQAKDAPPKTMKPDLPK